MSSRGRKGAIVCKYLSFYDPRLRETFHLPLVHIRVTHGEVTLRTDALIDSGATSTFFPLELAEVLDIELPQETEEAVGAGGDFSTYDIKIDLIQVIKGTRVLAHYF